MLNYCRKLTHLIIFTACSLIINFRNEESLFKGGFYICNYWKLCTCGYEINEFHMWDFENMYVQGNQTYGKCFSCNQYFPMNF